MNWFNIVYVILSAFGCYILYMFMSIFFDVLKTNRILHFLAYAAFHICSCIIYIYIENSVVFFLFNLVGYFLLTYNYAGTLIRKILATIIIFAIVNISEFIIPMLLRTLGLVSLQDGLYQIIAIQLLATRLILFIIALTVRNLKSIKQEIAIPYYYWITIALLPSFSFYIGLLIFNVDWINSITMLLGVTGILVINFSVFYLYNALIKAQTQKMQQAMLVEQNKSYKKQFDIIQEAALNAQMIRHDFKHHLAVISGMVDINSRDDCLDYISKLIKAENNFSNTINSGNIIIDSILNFKLSKAIKQNISITSKICISNDLFISPADMTIILGNLIDNAVEATLILEDKGKIDILIKETKGRFIIKISNTCVADIELNTDKYFTSKADKANHGLGLESIKSTLTKYDGELSLNKNKDVVTAMVLFYL